MKFNATQHSHISESIPVVLATIEPVSNPEKEDGYWWLREESFLRTLRNNYGEDRVHHLIAKILEVITGRDQAVNDLVYASNVNGADLRIQYIPDFIDHIGTETDEETGKNLVELAAPSFSPRKKALPFAKMLDISDDAVISIDENNKIIFYNQGAKNIFGHTENEIMGKSLDVLIPEDIRAQHALVIKEFAESQGSSQAMKNRQAISALRKNGETFPAEASISKIRVGDKIVLTAFLRDITERLAEQAKQRKSDARYRNLVETSQDMIWAVDDQGCFTYLNPIWAEPMEYEAEEMLGSPITDFLNLPQDRKEFESYLHQKDQPITFTAVFKSKSGKQIILKFKAISTFDESGDLTHCQGTAYNLTAQVQIEEKLRQSQKLQALGTLAGGVAHDLNNILTPIFVNSELMMKLSDRESVAHGIVKSIMASAQRAKDLVSQILVFSRADQQVERETVDLTSLAHEAAEFSRSTFSKNISLKEDYPSTCAPISCDPTQLHQVLVNLCVNASQAIPDRGHVELTVDTPDFVDYQCFEGILFNGPHARITISDTGIGMTPETLEHIFEPFFTTKKVGEGTGLGLSMVFGIVKNHNGGLRVCSEVGKGTRFEIFFPLAKLQPGFKKVEIEATEQLGEKNILFVDDEKEISSIGKLGLGLQGYNVTTAADGQEAWDLISQSPEGYDLIITDQNMPKMEGSTLAKKARELRPDIPIILCTGYTTDSLPELKGVGIDTIVHKPYLLSKLTEEIRTLIDKPQIVQKNAAGT